eukprot:14642068-Alexandrium_andersonii.AAC.1
MLWPSRSGQHSVKRYRRSGDVSDRVSVNLGENVPRGLHGRDRASVAAAIRVAARYNPREA